MKKQKTILLIVFVLAGISGLFAQPANPPNPTVNPPASCGATKTLTEAAAPGGVTYYWQGTDCNNNSTANNASSPYTVSYNCTNSIYYYVKARDNSTGQWSTDCGSVDVGMPRTSAPCKPSDPSTTNNTCGNQTLTRVGTPPPTDVVFYWQGTNPNGTSGADASSTYTVSATNTYYIRAYDNCNGQWSAISGSMLSTINNTLPAAPPAPTVNPPASCGETKTLTEAAPPGGVTYYWQGTNSEGTSTANNASSPYTVSYNCTNSIYYYVRTRSDAGCWSTNSGAVDVGMPRTSALCKPSDPSTTNNTCGNQTLTRVGTPPTDVVFYWQGTNPNGTSGADASSTYTVSATNTYYIRAYDNCNGQWSATSGSVLSTINNTLPAAPPVPTENTPACGNKYLTISPPVGVTYYWQGTGCNTSSSNSSSYYVSNNCTWSDYYVRARSDAGCWSASCNSLSVYNCNPTPCPPPADPPVPSISDYCGYKTLTRAVPPANVTYYWQGTNSSGTSMDNSGLTYTVSVSGNYYLRAYENSGSWSAGSALVAITITLDPACFINFYGGNNDGFAMKPYCSGTLNGATTALTINPISGNATFCNGGNESYSTSVITGTAEHFYWTAPSVFTIHQWQGISSILASFTSSGNINVAVSNSCETVAASKAITIVACGLHRGGNNDGFAMSRSSEEMALPIELLYFTAVPVDNSKVLTQWTTVSEINNDYFTIERSRDTKFCVPVCSPIGTVKGAGNSTAVLHYEFLDSTPFLNGTEGPGVLYYRLKQTDYNGQFSYSAPVAVIFKGLEFIDIMPDVEINTLKYVVVSLEETKVNIGVMDVLGRKIIINSQFAYTGTNQFDLDISKLNTGMYFLQITTESGLLKTQKIFVK